MKDIVKVVLGILIFIVIIMGLSYGFGWNKVLFTKTVGKAQQNAEREVFEETQSFVEGKRQEAIKRYSEYQLADEDTKKGIKNIVALSFANFDEDKYLTGDLRNFVHNCKYNP